MTTISFITFDLLIREIPYWHQMKGISLLYLVIFIILLLFSQNESKISRFFWYWVWVLGTFTVIELRPNHFFWCQLFFFNWINIFHKVEDRCFILLGQLEISVALSILEQLSSLFYRFTSLSLLKNVRNHQRMMIYPWQWSVISMISI